jgi:hypothetical protein
MKLTQLFALMLLSGCYQISNQDADGFVYKVNTLTGKMQLCGRVIPSGSTNGVGCIDIEYLPKLDRPPPPAPQP